MRVDKHEYRDLLLSVLLIGMIYWFKRWDELLLIALVFILLGLASKQFRILNQYLWLFVTKVMQSVFQPIVGGVIFFVFLTPIGLLSQLFKKKKRMTDSTFVAINQKIDKEFFTKQW